MSNESLAYKIEEFAIESITGSDAVLEGIPIVHHDRDPQSENERIICTAKCGEQELDGPQCYPVSLLIELRTTSRDAAHVEAVWGALWRAVKPANVVLGRAYATTVLDPLIYISEEGGDDRSDGKNTRFRSRTLTFKALEK